MELDGLKVTEEDKKFFATEFKLMDQNGDGLLDWWEFVNHESKLYLARRTKVFTRLLVFGYDCCHVLLFLKLF